MIHLLAVRPFKKPELISKLSKGKTCIIIKRFIELLDFCRILISKVDYFPPSVVNFHGKLTFKLSAIQL